MKSFLQAEAYNAKFMFDHQEDETYEVTAPLQQLLEKEAIFKWNGRREQSYQKLMRMMNN